MTNSVDFDFTDCRVLITGGTSGIGHSTARLFSSAGAHVTVTGTRETPTTYETDLSGFDYLQLVADDPDSTARVLDVFDSLDVLVNCAGANFPHGLDESTVEGFTASVSVNLFGPYQLTTGLHDALQRSTLDGGASVVNLASLSAFRAVTLVPGYSSAKAGTVAMTRNLAVTWASHGIRVNAVAPGVIDTPMTAPMSAVPEIADREMAMIPMREMGQPIHAAAAIAYLSSAASAYTTGAVVTVDGGRTAL